MKYFYVYNSHQIYHFLAGYVSLLSGFTLAVINMGTKPRKPHPATPPPSLRPFSKTFVLCYSFFAAPPFSCMASIQADSTQPCRLRYNKPSTRSQTSLQNITFLFPFHLWGSLRRNKKKPRSPSLPLIYVHQINNIWGLVFCIRILINKYLKIINASNSQVNSFFWVNSLVNWYLI